ncbi:Protein XAP5 CIRCADIAN TIMEKEEPER [Zea mays]|nr:Protein XAP5 CIRCADIAN TIMEKEEPER [Zea mays]
MTSLAASRSNSLNTAGKDPMAAGVSRRASLSSDAGGLPLDVYEPPPEFQLLTLTGMGLDTNGEFLMAMQQQLVHEIREVWTNSVENLLYMKEDLIIPHGCVHSLVIYEVLLKLVEPFSDSMFSLLFDNNTYFMN